MIQRGRKRGKLKQGKIIMKSGNFTKKSLLHTSVLSSKIGSNASEALTIPRKPPGKLTTRSLLFTSATTPHSFIPGVIFWHSRMSKKL